MRQPDIEQTASELREVMGRLVRRARHVDELAPRFATALGYLDREGPMTLGELAARQRVRQQSMTTTVAELAERGYVDRSAHPTDGRKTLIRLSARGREALARDRRSRLGWLAEAIRHQLDADEQRALGEAIPLLARLVAYAPPDAREPTGR